MMKSTRIFGAALLMACSESTLDPAQDAVTLAAASPTSQRVVAGNYVTDLPAVIAYDANGSPVAGAVVTFTMESGTGLIEHSVDTTNSAGVSKLRTWKVGTKAGVRNIVSASTTRTNTISFVVDIVAAPAAKIVKVTGDDQIGEMNRPLQVNPRVLVTDGYDNPVADQLVRFAVTKGGGSVTTTEAVTDAYGTVAVGWTVGTPGEQTLMMTAGPVAQTFHATAVTTFGACVQSTTLTGNATVGELLAGACNRDGRYYTNYYFITQFDAAWSIEMRSSAFDSYLELRDVNARVIAFNDNFQSSAKDSRIIAWLPAGTYQVVTLSNTPNVGGPFNISLLRTSAVPLGCEGLWVTSGAESGGQLHPLTCNGASLGNTDLFRMHLDAGESVTINLRDMSYDGFSIAIVNQEGAVLATHENGATYLDYVTRYTADRDIDVVIKVSSLSEWAEYSIDFN